LLIRVLEFQSQYRFVCECICAAYMKISRSSAAINDDED